MTITPAQHSNSEIVSMTRSDEIRERLVGINRRISHSCAKAGRDPQEVKLVAVTKTVTAETIKAAVEAGLYMFGENRVQEAVAKIPELAIVTSEKKVEWHFIGHLQSNKARRAVEVFDVLHTVDSEKLAERLSRAAIETNRRIPVLIEVNVGGESAKSGLAVDVVCSTVERVHKLDNIDLKGLMAVPPYFEQPQDVRTYFRRLRELRDSAQTIVGSGFSELSMGMSHDFEVAVEEGATILRIGTAIFGPRPEVAALSFGI